MRLLGLARFTPLIIGVTLGHVSLPRTSRNHESRAVSYTSRHPHTEHEGAGIFDSSAYGQLTASGKNTSNYLRTREQNSAFVIRISASRDGEGLGFATFPNPVPFCNQSSAERTSSA